MTKSEKLAFEIFSAHSINVDELSKLIKQHFEIIHNEAVEQTVMAENKKTFIKPKYED